MTLTLAPAYGRDYSSKRAVIEDLNADKDFRCSVTGRYANRNDLQQNSVERFFVRYGKLRKVMAVTLRDGKAVAK